MGIRLLREGSRRAAGEPLPQEEEPFEAVPEEPGMGFRADGAGNDPRGPGNAGRMVCLEGLLGLRKPGGGERGGQKGPGELGSPGGAAGG